MTILLSGSTGFLGSYLLKRFTQEGFDVIALKISTQSTAAIDHNDSTLESVADIHFTLHKEKVRSHVFKRELSNYNRHILPYFKGRQLSSIKPMEIEAWQNRLMVKYSVSSVMKIVVNTPKGSKTLEIHKHVATNSFTENKDLLS